MYSIRLFIFSVFLCLYSNVNAQWRPTANLTVFSEDGAKFYLILNGERYNDVPQTNIRIEELPNPYYNCKIIFEDKSLPELSKSRLMLADVDGVLQDVTYRIKKIIKDGMFCGFSLSYRRSKTCPGLQMFLYTDSGNQIK